jgi:DNA-binding transcriptional LysR family regulator
MNLDKLRVFCEAAVHGSFTRAAERLRLAQPSVSAHVRDLERSLGVPLFERRGRGVRLTEPGEVLFDYAKRIFALEADATQALAAFRGAEAGEVVVGASSTPGVYLLPPFLARYRAEHPGVRLSMHISDTGDVEAQLADLSIDVGVTGAPVSDMENEVWADDQLVLVVGPGHPWRETPPRRARALEGAPFIFREEGSAVRAATEMWLHERAIAVDTVMALDGNEAVKRAVTAGLGVTITTSYALRSELETGELSIVPLPGLPIKRRLYLSHNPRKPFTPAARELWNDLWRGR